MKIAQYFYIILLSTLIIVCVSSQKSQLHKKARIQRTKKKKGLQNEGQTSTKVKLNQMKIKYKNLLLKYYSNSSLLGEIGVRATDFWTSKYVQSLLNQNQNINNLAADSVQLEKKYSSNIQLNNIIEKGNYQAIMKQIDTISSDNTTIKNKKLNALIKMYSIIKQAIQSKTIISEYFEIVMKTAEEEVVWLKSSITTIQSQRQKSKIKNKTAVVKDIQGRLKNYQQMNRIMNSSIDKNRMQIPKYQQQIKQIQTQNIIQTNKLNQLKQRRNQKDEEIQQLLRQINEVKNVKKSIQNNITESSLFIKQNQVKIEMFNDLMGQTDQLVKYIQLMEDRAKRESRIVEVFLERVREDWSEAYAKGRSKSDSLQRVQQQVSFLKRKTFYQDTISTIRNSIKNLKFILPNIQAGLKKQTQKFVKTIEQQNLDDISKMQKANILDPMQKDYTCLFDSYTLSYKQGIIKRIQKKYIYIQDYLQNSFKLSIGKCSKITSSSIRPMPEQRILWKGFLINEQQREYNLFDALVL